MLVCFHCGAANSPGKTHCHSCASALPQSASDDADEGGSGNAPMVVCIHCGQQNIPGSAECNNCGAVIPQMDRSTYYRTHDTITERYDEFRVAAEKARAGEWSPQELKQWLENMESLLSKRRDYLINVIKGADYYEYRSEEVELGVTGVFDYEEGMNLMSGFVEDGNPMHLDVGLEKIWEGNEKINEAMRMNREFRRKLEEEWGYM